MPDGWRKIRLCEVFEVSNVRLGAHDVEPTILSLSKYDGFVRSDEYFDKRIASKRLDEYKVVLKDEWAFSTIHIDEGSIARNSMVSFGVISPMYTTMRWVSEEHDPGFFELLLRSPQMLQEYAAHAQGSINRRRSLAYAKFAELEVVVPPLDVQRRIADLVAGLDSLLAALQAEINAAKAMSAAIQAEHLRAGIGMVKGRLGDFAHVQVGYPFASSAFTEAESDVRLLRGDNLEPGAIRWRRAKRWPTAETSGFDAYQLNVGDVVVAMDRTWVSGGLKVATVKNQDLPALLVQRVARLTAKPGFSQRLLPFLVDSSAFQRMVLSEQTGSAVPHISARQIQSLEIDFPQDFKTQEAVAELLEHGRANTENLAAERASASLMREALLGDLLSGDLEVEPSYDQLLAKVR
ncbi:MAG: restriction endonuclease subunit S [Candidatus Nanopelagicales bacterium]